MVRTGPSRALVTSYCEHRTVVTPDATRSCALTRPEAAPLDARELQVPLGHKAPARAGPSRAGPKGLPLSRGLRGARPGRPQVQRGPCEAPLPPAASGGRVALAL